jgi:hypothetical protein|tara:strand:+ start:4421 stop:4750 length:330 start_codon:yes stop_codon:yes gene_type:complete
MNKRKPVKNIKPGDILLVESFAGPRVHVKVTKEFLKKKDEWGADGWDGILIYDSDIKALIVAGVPYDSNINQEVWVFNFQIIKKCKNKKDTTGKENDTVKKGRRRIIRK